ALLRSIFFQSSGAPPDLHPFPTRRSSDLVGLRGKDDRKVKNPRFRVKVIAPDKTETIVPAAGKPGEDQHGTFLKTDLPGEYVMRSEEHTSELQSPYDLVCRLLLEKKKKKD